MTPVSQYRYTEAEFVARLQDAVQATLERRRRQRDVRAALDTRRQAAMPARHRTKLRHSHQEDPTDRQPLTEAQREALDRLGRQGQRRQHPPEKVDSHIPAQGDPMIVNASTRPGTGAPGTGNRTRPDRVVTCRMLTERHGSLDRCTAEALDADSGILICEHHAAKVLALVHDRFQQAGGGQ